MLRRTLNVIKKAIMFTQYTVFLLPLLMSNIFCTSAAVHSYSVDSPERESDGAYRPRDHDHYTDAGHNAEFDHEAILGSVKEAEEYDRLSPEKSRKRLSLLLPKMDLNSDSFIDRKELKQWILNSFINLSKEEAEDRMSEADDNKDAIVTWTEYLKDAFGVDSEEEIDPEDTGDSGLLVREERAMWTVADVDGDGSLDFDEFSIFTSPEEHPVMHPFLLNQTLREKDANKDGFIDFNEYVGERDTPQDKDWLLSEKDKFEGELDVNSDGVLDAEEVRRWVIPDNDEIAEEEVDHLMAAADDDHDDLLSYDEVLDHHHAFVGSNHHGRFDDEL